jgi:hypothetical protein
MVQLYSSSGHQLYKAIGSVVEEVGVNQVRKTGGMA